MSRIPTPCFALLHEYITPSFIQGTSSSRLLVCRVVDFEFNVQVEHPLKESSPWYVLGTGQCFHG